MKNVLVIVLSMLIVVVSVFLGYQLLKSPKLKIGSSLSLVPVSSPDVNNPPYLAEEKKMVDIINSDCKEVQPFSDQKASTNYFLKLFAKLGDDVYFDSQASSFVSRSNGYFNFFTLNPNRERNIQDSNSPRCQLIWMSGNRGSGNIVYETLAGETKTVHLDFIPVELFPKNQ